MTLTDQTFWAITVCLLTLNAQNGAAQDLSADGSIAALSAQLDAQAAELQELRERLDRREAIYEPKPDAKQANCGPAPVIQRLPLVVDQVEKPGCGGEKLSTFRTLSYFVEYDRGLVLRPFDPDKHPYELKVNGWVQFRHHAFDQDEATWTDNAGVIRPIRDRNAFDIERARLVLSGYALDERLTYFVHMDGDTDEGHVVDFFDYWWGWQFSDRFQLQAGKRKVTASRQWLLTARNTRFVDRPMANDFFRPDRTVGVFGVGQIGDSGHYELMIGNGYRTANLPDASVDDRFTYAFTNYFDPLGDLGPQIVDYDYSCDPRLRFGQSGVYSPQTSDELGISLEEADFLRLTDGTLLTQIGALAPGVTVSDFDLYFYGLDAALKWRGWSMNAEVFLQWLRDFRANGDLPVTDLFRRGFYIEGGRFLVPKKLDANLRYSQVSGLLGEATEYAAGVNWYPLDTLKLKFSFDITLLDGSPLQNTASDILVGDDGALYRTQFQAEF